jgi:hypothetical protein
MGKKVFISGTEVIQTFFAVWGHRELVLFATPIARAEDFTIEAVLRELVSFVLPKFL